MAIVTVCSSEIRLRYNKCSNSSVVRRLTNHELQKQVLSFHFIINKYFPLTMIFFWTHIHLYQRHKARLLFEYVTLHLNSFYKKILAIFMCNFKESKKAMLFYEALIYQGTIIDKSFLQPGTGSANVRQLAKASLD
jgi:hypothetical protein